MAFIKWPCSFARN